MTFHPTVRDRFIHLLILFVCAGLVAASAFFFVWSASPNAGQFGQTLAVTSALLLVSLYINWMAWSASVRVHDRGVDWTEGKNSGSLTWECIAGFSWKVERKNLQVGLVEKSAGELRILPFLSAPLYAALRDRVGRLPADIEKKMGFRV